MFSWQRRALRSAYKTALQASLFELQTHGVDNQGTLPASAKLGRPAAGETQSSLP
jgi:hypothetical protein